METRYRANRFPAPVGTNYDDIDLTALTVTDEETGNRVGTVVGCRASEDAVVFIVDLNTIGQDLVTVAPHAGVTIAFGATKVDATPYVPSSNADFVTVPAPAELEVEPDAYTASLEEALERREVGARLLDKILRTFHQDGTITDEGGLIGYAALNDGELLLDDELALVRARVRAGFQPDRSEL